MIAETLLIIEKGPVIDGQSRILAGREMYPPHAASETTLDEIETTEAAIDQTAVDQTAVDQTVVATDQMMIIATALRMVDAIETIVPATETTQIEERTMIGSGLTKQRSFKHSH